MRSGYNELSLQIPTEKYQIKTWFRGISVERNRYEGFWLTHLCFRPGVSIAFKHALREFRILLIFAACGADSLIALP